MTWTTSSGLQDAHASAFDAEPSFGEEMNRLGICFAFLLEDSRRQAIRRVIFQGIDCALKNDWPVIVLIVAEMDGAAGDFDAGGQHRLMNMMAVIPFAAESRDQGRMNIHHPALEIIGNLNQLQETGQANQLGPMLAAKIEKFSAEFLS